MGDRKQPTPPPTNQRRPDPPPPPPEKRFDGDRPMTVLVPAPRVGFRELRTSSHLFNIKSDVTYQVSETLTFYVDGVEVTQDEYLRIAREDGEYFNVNRVVAP